MRISSRWPHRCVIHFRYVSEKPNRFDVFRALNLNTFSAEEIRKSFNALCQSDTVVKSSTLLRLYENIGRRKKIPNHELGNSKHQESFLKMFNSDKDKNLEYAQYERTIKEMGTVIDPKVWAVSASHFLAGVSIGIIVPCMPLLVNELNIAPSFFGLIISSFGLSKLLGNIPSAHFVNTIGRKPMMVAGLGLCTLGVGGIGLSLVPSFGASWILACRVVTGLGVSAFTAGAFMFLADVSTTLNRARSAAPVMAAFNAGIAIGPAFGGLMIQNHGIACTYFLVGGLFAALTAMNHIFLVETRPQSNGYVLPSLEMPLLELAVKQPPVELFSNALETALTTWRNLLKNREIRDVVMLNMVYMVAMTGTQLTTLQLYMVSPALDFTPADIGYTYTGMSIISVAMTQPIAYLADKHSKPLLSIVGCGLVAMAALTIPFTTSLGELGLTVCPLALGTTILGSVPNAHIVNISPREHRAQAQSLLRTCGDVGMLVGGSMAGFLVELTSVETAMRSNGLLLLTFVGYLGARRTFLVSSIETSIDVMPSEPKDKGI